MFHTRFRAPRDENVFHGGVVQPVAVHFDHQILHVLALHRPVTAVDLRPYGCQGMDVDPQHAQQVRLRLL